MSSVNAPLPQPTSIQRKPASGASQSRKISPASRLQVPIIRSYAAPSSKRICSSAINILLRSDVILILIDLLDDLDRRVAVSAASALGRMGRSETRPVLKGLLRDDPSEEVIDAVSSIADEECAVLLGRIARSRPALAEAALISLENVDDARAAGIAAAIRRLRP